MASVAVAGLVAAAGYIAKLLSDKNADADEDDNKSEMNEYEPSLKHGHHGFCKLI
jgi:hypothetical protein